MGSLLFLKNFPGGIFGKNICITYTSHAYPGYWKGKTHEH